MYKLFYKKDKPGLVFVNERIFQKNIYLYSAKKCKSDSNPYGGYVKKTKKNCLID